MKKSISAALLATAAILPASAYAATVSSSLTYVKNNVGLDGGDAVGFDEFTTTNVGIANLRYGAKASGGEVDAEGKIGFSTTFADTVNLADASDVKFSLNRTSLAFDYDAFTGAEAGLFVDFFSFAGVNPREFRAIGKDYTLTNSDSRSGSFGSTGTERDTETITGVGPDFSLGLGFRAVTTLDASQTTSFTVSDFVGTVEAEHESGAIKTVAFSLFSDPMKSLDLSLAGKWDISLLDLRLRNSFDSATGLSVGYELGLAAGELFGGCGDYSTDDDNENSVIPPRACLADTGVSGDTPQLSLIDPDPFEIAWGTKSLFDIGHITVLAPAPPPPPGPGTVPLPAGLPMLLAGLTGFGLLRRKSSKSTA